MNPTQSVGLQDTPLYGRTRLNGFMALINDISWKFPLFSPHHCPRHILGIHLSTRHNKPNPVRWTTGHTPIRTEKTLRLYSLIKEISHYFQRITAPAHILGHRYNEPNPVHWTTGHTPIWMGKTLRYMTFLN